MKQLLIILMAASLAVGCKGKKAASSGWPQADKDAFTDNCVKGATAGMGEDKAKSYCSCMLGKVEAKYSKPQDAGSLDMNTMTEMAKDCLK
jgi:hypothetical protein